MKPLQLVLPLGLLCAPLSAHVELDSPNGGETVTVGSTIEIQWHVSAAHNTQNWDLWYSTTGENGPWIPIAMDLPPGDISDGAAHKYLWRVPAGLSGRMHVRVRQDNSGDDYFDVSENRFTVAEAMASYATFGTGCPGSAGTPTLSPGTAGMPRVAEPFEVELSGLPTNSPGAFLAIGFSKTLPKDLTDIGMPGCDSHLEVFLGIPVLPSQGSATWSFTIPNHLGLIGVSFYNQGFVLDPGAPNALRVAATNAAEGRIGAR